MRDNDRLLIQAKYPNARIVEATPENPAPWSPTCEIIMFDEISEELYACPPDSAAVSSLRQFLVDLRRKAQ